MTFTLRRTKSIPAMQAEVQEYEDSATGARHIHLAADTDEMVFLVAFPTVPELGDGRAHILEHLVLCGSERYPVRDPFFAMSRRSTAHFMNAMTYADKTVYPFASTDRTDFFNLLDVYLDAVFFPRLDYLDFLQEGWRLVDEDGRLSYQGVVMNEMKGAFADVLRAVDQGITAHLLAGTTYAMESGGDPLEIPSLTYAALKEFHATHYHPSQAVFMTAGGVVPAEVQQLIGERVLSRLSGRMPLLMPQLALDQMAHVAVQLQTPAREYGAYLYWRLGQSTDPVAYYQTELLEAGLIGNAASPVTHAMESAGFGRPSPLIGHDPFARQSVFKLGMEGLAEDQVDDARARIWSALETAAEHGVPQSVLLASLRDLRFRQREIRAGSTPNLLRRLLDAIPHAMYGGDIMNGFDAEDVLRDLQEKTADPGFFKGLAGALLDAPARVDAVTVPDAGYFQKRQDIEDARLAALQAAMPEPERERLRAESAALQKRQRQPADNALLPRIRPQDVSPAPRPALALPLLAGEGAAALSIASNGVSYARVMYDVSGFEEAAWPWLDLYTQLVPDVGVGSRTYEEADAWRHERVSFFDVNLQFTQTQENGGALRLHVDFYAKGLREEGAAMAEVLSESLRAARFDEYERLAFLIDSMFRDTLDGLAEEGDDYARYAAGAPLSPVRRFQHRTIGAAGLTFYGALQHKLGSVEGRQEIAGRLAALHARILGATPTVMTAGTGQDGHELAGLIELPSAPVSESPGTSASTVPAATNLALHAEAQVNHCFAVWRAPAFSHPDAAPLAVLGELLTNLVLHQAVREEGGAYGASAMYSATTGTFSMTSYRDPRLRATYADFERAASALMANEPSLESLEEAIIGVIQTIDRPRTPFEEVMWSWDQMQQGITEQMRRDYRSRLLQCSLQDVRRAAANWLIGQPCNRTAFVGRLDQNLAGLEVVRLLDLV
ncbi:MAG: insulinase family protein [Noviherbaspirillum sp.]